MSATSSTTPHVSKDGERWVPVNINDRYLVSTFGRVWDTVDTRIVQPTEKPYGRKNVYKAMTINMKLDQVRQRPFVHNVVAEAFMDPPTNYMVEHLDHDHKNNRVDNLRVVHSTSKVGRHLDRAVVEIMANGKERRHDSMKKAAESVGMSVGNMRLTYIEKRNVHHLGSTFHYEDPTPKRQRIFAPDNIEPVE
jgi:hypothetical protein